MSQENPSQDAPSQETPSQETWTAVDEYFSAGLVREDPILEAALEASSAAGLPPISVSPNQGKLLYLLARVLGAKAILEVGTLGGYSAIWLARALAAGGRMVTLEFDPKHAALARANLERAGLAEIVEVKVGRAIDTLPTLSGPYDLVFIDADKPSTPDYFGWALKLTKRGSLIIVDNVVRNGTVVDPASGDANTEGIRRFQELLSKEARVDATAIQTVGVKGYDGFAIALVTGD